MQMGNTLQGTLLSIPGGIEGFLPAQIGVVGAGFWVGVLIGGFKLHVRYRDFWESFCMISWLVFRVIGLAPYGKEALQRTWPRQTIGQGGNYLQANYAPPHDRGSGRHYALGSKP
jgi:hypothetical protein